MLRSLHTFLIAVSFRSFLYFSLIKILEGLSITFSANGKLRSKTSLHFAKNGRNSFDMSSFLAYYQQVSGNFPKERD